MASLFVTFPLRPGDPARIGPYRLDGRLGAGGMGQVYLGSSPSGRVVAVELIWLVTAFIPGPTLQRVVAEHGPLASAAVARLGAGLAEGLAAIHRCGLVRRDVKPGNVIMADDGPRIIDFGIAHAEDGDSTTGSGAVIGTYASMSPEQARAEPVSAAGDVFSLGSVLVFAATGRSPFDAPTIAAIVHRILHDRPALDDLSGDLHSVLAACLAKEPTDRPAAQSLPARFTSLHPDGTALPPGAALPAPAVERTVPATTLHPQAWIEPDPQPAPLIRPEPSHELSRRTLIIGGLAATAAVAGTSVLLYGRERSASRSGRPTASDYVFSAAFSPDGRTLAAAGLFRGRVCVGHLLRPLPRRLQGLAVGRLAFSPDGRLLLTGDQPIQLRAMPSGRVTAAYDYRFGYAPGAVAFSPDSQVLAITVHETIYLWNVVTQRPITTLKGHTGYIRALAFHPRGGTLAGGDDKTIRLWNSATGATVTRFTTPDSVSALTFAPDGSTLAAGLSGGGSGTADDSIRLWHIP